MSYAKRFHRRQYVKGSLWIAPVLPSTAVQVLSRIEDLLRCIGKTWLRVPARLRDEHGEVRVLLRAPRWEDYLAMGVTEIREYGGDSIQVVRALRKHLEDLHREVLPPYRAGVEEELRRLEAGVELQFAGSPDLDLAREADAQGLGGLPSREAAHG